MEDLQIYSIVNDLAQQATGQKNLTVVSEQGLIALGNVVLNSQDYTDNFLNVLVERIGKTIISHKAYRNKFSFLMKTSMEFGAIVQKIKVRAKVAEEDPSYNLTDEDSIDPWTINKPTVTQKLFVTNTPYMLSITVQREHLVEAFKSGDAMSSFISAIYGEVQTKIEHSLENLGRTCLVNRMAEAKTTQVVNLRTLYNATVDDADKINSASEALQRTDFLRFAIQTIKNVMDEMTCINVKYNDGSIEEHTPLERQTVVAMSRFQNALETQVTYSAFHKEYLDIAKVEKVPYWQALSNPFKIDVARASDNSEVTIDNIVACIFDKDACGLFNEKKTVATTPLNAKGLYTNTFYHLKQLWFNDLSEQFVLFTLN